MVNKYAKGKARFEHHEFKESNNIIGESSESNNIMDNEYMEIDENEENYFCDISNKKQKYYNDQISLVNNWDSITEIIFKGIIESQGFVEKPFCIKCKKEAFLRYLDCGPNIYFCYECDIY